MTSPAAYLDAEALSVRYSVHVGTIWHWSKIGHLPAAVKLSKGCTRWRLSDLLEWEKRRAENPELVRHRGRPRKDAQAARATA